MFNGCYRQEVGANSSVVNKYDYEKEIRYGIKFLQERKYSSKKFYQD